MKKPPPPPPLLPRRRDAFAAGEKQYGGYTAEHSKFYQLYLQSGKVTLAVMCLRRVRVNGRRSAAALTLAVKWPG
jgi:hypothetical protein